MAIMSAGDSWHKSCLQSDPLGAVTLHAVNLCCAGPRAGGPNGNAPVSTTAHHIGRSSPVRAASLRRKSMDDEVEISSGTDTDEDGALIEKARQAAEQKRAPPKKRGPTSMSWQ